MSELIDGPRMDPVSGEPARSLVILLHGYGSNGEDLIGLGIDWRDALPHTAFVAPNAPEICPGAPDGYQWWDVSTFDRASIVAGVNQAAPALNAFIDAELAAKGLSEEQLVLVGFSQGTIMALHVGPRRARRLAGILGYSGMLADPEGLGDLNKPPVMLIHGDADPMVPVSAYHNAAEALEGAGFQVQGKVCRGLGHGIDLVGLRAGAQFVEAALRG